MFKKRIIQGVVSLLIIGLTVFTAICVSNSASAASYNVTDDMAKEMFSSFKNVYYTENGDRGNISGERCWSLSEIFEIVLDAYEKTGDASYKNMIKKVYNSYVGYNGTNWMGNKYNDDIMWMIIACARAYNLTGDTLYRDQAKTHFDQTFARSWSSDLGGGLWWTTDNNTKNSCICGPAIIAACLLGDIYNDESYYQKAVQIYEWQRANLSNPSTGQVFDSYNIKGEKNYWSSTYNQGTFIGAATLLYEHYNQINYLDDAIRVADHTMNAMYKGGVMNNEESGGDLPGFKGIFTRWINRLIVNHNQPQYIEWLQLNATTAYNNRNSKGITSTQWNTKTSDSASITAFSASTAVALLINCPKTTTIVKDAYSTIQAEKFDSIKGGIVENCNDGTKNIGGIQNNYYSCYRNVDFGNTGAKSASFRVSSGSNGGTIEIRIGAFDGSLIGTATVPASNSWSTYTDVTCDTSKVTGLQDVFLVFKGSSYVANFNYFKFVANPVETPTNTEDSTNLIATSASQTKVGIYGDANYGGASALLGIGEYNINNLASLGISNDSISSIKVPVGYKVTVYADANFSGLSKVYASDSNYVGNDWNDKVSSMKVEQAQYWIVSRHSGLVLDIDSAKQENGTNLIQWYNNGGVWQKWTINYLDNGYCYIASAMHGKVIDVQDISKSAGANVHLWEYVSGANQMWKIQFTTDGFAAIINYNSGMGLDVAEWSVEGAANIHQWTYYNQANQEWQFVLAN